MHLFTSDHSFGKNHLRSPLFNTPPPILKHKKKRQHDFIAPCEVPAAAGEPLQLGVSAVAVAG